jgi:Zn-dependent metalloprotease
MWNLSRCVIVAVVITVIPASVISASGQVETAKTRVDKAVAALKRDHPGAKVELNEKTGLPRSIRGLVSPQIGLAPAPKAKLEDVDKIVGEFFSSNQGLFLQSGPAPGIRITQKKMDPQIPGRAIARVQQIVNGVDIFGAEAAVGVDLAAADVDKLTTTFVVPPTLDLHPSVSSVDAEARVRKDYAAELTAHTDTAQTEIALAGREPRLLSKLIIFDPTVFNLPTTGLRLTWLIKIGTFLYFVDARDGAIVHKYRDLSSAKTRSTYDANFGGTIPGKLVINEAGGIAGIDPSADAKLAHEYAGSTYDYYMKEFSRDSYDNSPAGGAPLISTVQYLQIQNAYWKMDIHQMIYGPGFAAAPDVVGHEITHGVIEAETHLQYYGESGAANEAFADLFGVMVAASRSGTIDWKIGVGIPGFSSNHPLRNLAKPHNGGFDPKQVFSATNQGQPDYYTEMVSSGNPICSSTSDRDNGCVHFNSGILNQAFYLAASGGTGPHGDITVIALGTNKLEQILYRTLTTDKLTSSALFKDVARGSVEACGDLATQAKFGISTADCSHLEDAYRSVGISII